jgi:hypothetical protein
MLDEETFNRIYNVFFLEEHRLESDIVDKTNFIARYRPTDYEPYIELLLSQARLNYFNAYIFPLLDWLEHFVGECEN